MADPIIYNGEVRGVRYGVGPFKWKSLVRGVLRALQSTDEPCAPLSPDYSELHSIYEQLLYPSAISLEENEVFLLKSEEKKKNKPLPPRGGTWVMLDVFSRFPRGMETYPEGASYVERLGTPRILVTGGGTLHNEHISLPYMLDDDPYYNFVFGRITDHPTGKYYGCHPRKFYTASKGELPGWPWIDTRDPEVAFGRLVKLSAVVGSEWADTYQGFKGVFTVEFLQLNGEPFETGEEEEPSEEGSYARRGRLDSVEVEFALDTSNYPFGYGFDTETWYEISVMSLTKDGSKAVIGIHSNAFESQEGICYDFVVLDFTVSDFTLPEFARFIPRTEVTMTDSVSGSGGSSGTLSFPVIKAEAIYDVPLIIHPEAESSVLLSKYKWFTPTFNNHTQDNLGNTHPSSSSASETLRAYITYFIYFNNKEELVRCFLDVETAKNHTHTYTKLEAKPESNPYRMRTAYTEQRSPEYVYQRGDVVAQGSDNYFVCVKPHLIGTQPAGLTTISGTSYDSNPEYWRFFYGRRLVNNTLEQCIWQAWNSDEAEDLAISGIASGKAVLDGHNVFRFAEVIDQQYNYDDQGNEYEVWNIPYSPWPHPHEPSRTPSVTVERSNSTSRSTTNTISFKQELLDEVGDKETRVIGTMTHNYSSSGVGHDRFLLPFTCTGLFGYLDENTGNVFPSNLYYSRMGTSGGQNSESWSIDGEPAISSSASVSFPSPPGNDCDWSNNGGAPTPAPTDGRLVTTGFPITSTEVFDDPSQPEFFGKPKSTYVFDGSRLVFPDLWLYVYSIDGVGIGLMPNATSGANSSGACIDGSSDKGSHQVIWGVAAPAYSNSLIHDPALIETDPEQGEDIRYFLMPILARKTYALAAPAPYIFSPEEWDEGAVEPPNDGLLLKPIFGPEKGICNQQQISYLGYLYQDELRESEEGGE